MGLVLDIRDAIERRQAEIKALMTEMWPHLSSKTLPEFVKLDRELDALDQRLYATAQDRNTSLRGH
jgi:hypothetical protein